MKRLNSIAKVAAIAALLLPFLLFPPNAIAGTDTYPTSINGCRYVSNGGAVSGNCDLKDSAQDLYFDSWSEENRECTSYVAWMLSSVNGYTMPFNDDAVYWGSDATNRNITVDMNPVAGSIFWSSTHDHVAYVESVSSDKSTVTLEDYNQGYPTNPGLWKEYGVAANTASGYIHFKDKFAYQIAFQANNNDFYTYSSSTGSANGTTLGMVSGTSPSITHTTTGYESAFEANNGDLYVYNSTNGATDLSQGVAAGTSPSIAAFPGGGWEIAFQDNTGSLHLYNSTNGTTAVSLGMASGTSPAIVALTNSWFEVAAQANTGYLYAYNSSSGISSSLAQGMATGTSPAIAALSSSEWEMSFQANNNNMYVYNSSSGSTGFTLGMLSGTSPAISGQ